MLTDLNEVERLLHCRLSLAAAAFAIVNASANAADAPEAADPEIAKLVREVSPARLETYVRTLAGFERSLATYPLTLRNPLLPPVK